MHHNYTKIKCFLVLAKLEPEYGSRASALAQEAGVNPDSLYVLLPRWVKWKYVKRWHGRSKRLAGTGRWIFFYSLTPHGRDWLKRASGWHPEYSLAIEEIQQLKLERAQAAARVAALRARA